VALPPTTLFPPNARVQIQPGMIVDAACVITPGTAATLVTAQGLGPNVTVNVQAGMNVKAIVLVSSTGQFVTL
jgi:hypothetical protein